MLGKVSFIDDFDELNSMINNGKYKII
jgi:hypothetical protein